MKSMPYFGREKRERKRFGLGIVGGSGYGAGELLRMLSLHPEIEACSVTSRAHAGNPVSSVHSHLENVCGLSFESSVSLERLQEYERSAVVLAMPSGQAVSAAEGLLRDGLPNSACLVDLSGDLRLRNPEEHACFYPEVEFAKDLRSRFVYGLTELDRAAIAKARFITNPGCLASAAILALWPLKGLATTGQTIIDAKTGTSGAGREPQPSMHHPGRFGDFTAYKALQHRHEPEILQALGDTLLRENGFMFVPHLIPVSRGIFVSAYVTLAADTSVEAIRQRYEAAFEGSPLIRFRAAPPRLVDVVGTNFCDISFALRGKQLVVMAALDNLGKGMVGAALQNLNLMFGLPETTGLLHASVGPA
jgi:N-acetyl-gamma-glutamyl-phosphate reductase